MKMSQLITRGVRTCRPSDSLRDAARLMWKYESGCLVVTTGDDSRRVVGLITDRDICMAAFVPDVDPKTLRVRDAMSTEIAGWGLTDAAAAAETAALHSEVHPFALLDERGELLGLISPSRSTPIELDHMGADFGGTEAS